MVIRDISDSFLSQTIQNKKGYLQPTTQERFLAVVFDILFFIPIFSIIFFKFIKKINITQVVAPQSELMTWYTLTSLFLFLVSFSFYQAIMIYLKGATLGKSFFKIKVIGLEKSQLTWNQAFLRSIAWSIECLFLGVSFLEVIANDKKKSIHDKLAETQVVTLKKESLHSPVFKIEKAFIGMMYLTLFFIFSISTTQYFLGKINKVEKNILATMLEQSPCQNEINNMKTEDLLVEWLFNSEQSKCLEKKISINFQTQKSDLTTLIAAFSLNQYDAEKRAEYKKLICSADEESCAWTNQYENYLKDIKISDFSVPKNNSYFYHFWYAKAASDLKSYSESNLILKKINLNDEHLNYFLELKLKNAVGLGDRKTVDSTMEVLSKLVTEEKYAQLKKWVPTSMSSSLRAPASETK